LIFIHEGQYRNWIVPKGTIVTVEAINIVPYVTFENWWLTYPNSQNNPCTFIVDKSFMNVSTRIADSVAPNFLGVTMQTPKIFEDNLLVSFTLESGRFSPYYLINKPYGVHFYIDGQPYEDAALSETNNNGVYQYTMTIPLSTLGESPHYFYVFAHASFSPPHPEDVYLTSLSDGSQFSNIVYYSPESSESKTANPPISFGTEILAATIIAVVIVAIVAILVIVPKLKKGLN
jgi:hypothetical protein